MWPDALMSHVEFNNNYMSCPLFVSSCHALCGMLIQRISHVAGSNVRKPLLLGEMSKLIGCSPHIHQPSAANL